MIFILNHIITLTKKISKYISSSYFILKIKNLISKISSILNFCFLNYFKMDLNYKKHLNSAMYSSRMYRIKNNSKNYLYKIKKKSKLS